jgi:hypothetical protein
VYIHIYVYIYICIYIHIYVYMYVCTSVLAILGFELELLGKYTSSKFSKLLYNLKSKNYCVIIHMGF